VVEKRFDARDTLVYKGLCAAEQPGYVRLLGGPAAVFGREIK